MNDKIIIELYPYNELSTIRTDLDILVLYKDGAYEVTNFLDEDAENRLSDILYYGYLPLKM